MLLFLPPIEGGGLAVDFLLQLQHAVQQRFGGGRAAGHIDIHRHHTVATAHHLHPHHTTPHHPPIVAAKAKHSTAQQRIIKREREEMRGLLQGAGEGGRRRGVSVCTA